MSDVRMKSEIIAYISSLWAEHPQLRFFQLMQYVMGNGDLFYVGDEVFLNKLKERFDKTQVVKLNE